jgi:hypothetical protein
MTGRGRSGGSPASTARSEPEDLALLRATASILAERAQLRQVQRALGHSNRGSHGGAGSSGSAGAPLMVTMAALKHPTVLRPSPAAPAATLNDPNASGGNVELGSGSSAEAEEQREQQERLRELERSETSLRERGHVREAEAARRHLEMLRARWSQDHGAGERAAGAAGAPPLPQGGVHLQKGARLRVRRSGVNHDWCEVEHVSAGQRVSGYVHASALDLRPAVAAAVAAASSSRAVGGAGTATMARSPASSLGQGLGRPPSRAPQLPGPGARGGSQNNSHISPGPVRGRPAAASPRSSPGAWHSPRTAAAAPTTTMHTGGGGRGGQQPPGPAVAVAGTMVEIAEDGQSELPTTTFACELEVLSIAAQPTRQPAATSRTAAAAAPAPEPEPAPAPAAAAAAAPPLLRAEATAAPAGGRGQHHSPSAGAGGGEAVGRPSSPTGRPPAAAAAAAGTAAGGPPASAATSPTLTVVDAAAQPLYSLLGDCGLERHIDLLRSVSFDVEKCAEATEAQWKAIGFPLGDATTIRDAARRQLGRPPLSEQHGAAPSAASPRSPQGSVDDRASSISGSNRDNHDRLVQPLAAKCKAQGTSISEMSDSGYQGDDQLEEQELDTDPIPEEIEPETQPQPEPEPKPKPKPKPEVPSVPSVPSRRPSRGGGKLGNFAKKRSSSSSSPTAASPTTTARRAGQTPQPSSPAASARSQQEGSSSYVASGGVAEQSGLLLDSMSTEQLQEWLRTIGLGQYANTVAGGGGEPGVTGAELLTYDDHLLRQTFRFKAGDKTRLNQHLGEQKRLIEQRNVAAKTGVGLAKFVKNNTSRPSAYRSV